jgi:hypothetical protein
MEQMSAVTVRLVTATVVGVGSGAASGFLSNLRGFLCGQAGREGGISGEEFLRRILANAFMNGLWSFLGQFQQEMLGQLQTRIATRFAFAAARNVAGYVFSQGINRAPPTMPGILLTLLITLGQFAWEVVASGNTVENDLVVNMVFGAFTEFVTNYAWSSVASALYDWFYAANNGDQCGPGIF